MNHIDLTYCIQFSTPFHIGTGLGFAKMVDDLVTRAGPAKAEGVRLPCIPGSSMKGKVRSRCEAIAKTLGLRVCGISDSQSEGEAAEAEPSDRTPRRKDGRKCKVNLCIICRLFGSPYSPGHLQFSDALLESEWQQMGYRLGRDQEAERETTDPFALAVVRAGNKLERATRTVESDFLFSLEHTADGLLYKGSIAGQVDTRPVQGMSVLLPLEGWLLTVGLLALDKIGGLRSRGLGRCRISVTCLKVDGGSDLAEGLNDLLAQEDYLLGLSEYEK
jgi:CRISPR/Cas system CSM-associated protein Csm3 (group 7 of RAMP superfamily)